MYTAEQTCVTDLTEDLHVPISITQTTLQYAFSSFHYFNINIARSTVTTNMSAIIPYRYSQIIHKLKMSNPRRSPQSYQMVFHDDDTL